MKLNKFLLGFIGTTANAGVVAATTLGTRSLLPESLSVVSVSAPAIDTPAVRETQPSESTDSVASNQKSTNSSTPLSESATKMDALKKGWEKYESCRGHSLHNTCKYLLPKWFDESFPSFKELVS